MYFILSNMFSEIRVLMHLNFDNKNIDVNSVYNTIKFILRYFKGLLLFKNVMNL